MAQRNMPRQQQRPAQRKKPMPRGEGYRELPDDALEAALSDIAGQFQDAHEAYMLAIETHNSTTPTSNADHLNNYLERMNRLSELTIPIRAEFNRRAVGQGKKEANKSAAERFVDEHVQEGDEAEADRNRTGAEREDWQLELTNELNSREATRTGGRTRPYRTFSALWNQATRDDERVDADRERVQQEENDRVGAEREDSVLDAHRGAFRETDPAKNHADKDHRTFSGLYDEAHRENDKRTDIPNSTEYQTEQAMQEILSNIDKATENRNKAIETYEKGSIWSKIRHPDSILDAAKNRRQMKGLTELKSELLVEEVIYADQKQSLVDERVVLENEQIDGGVSKETVIEAMEEITMKMKILEKNHENKKARILDRLEKIGINVSSQRKKEVEPNLDNVGTNSTPLTGDERSWKKDQEDSIASDPNIRLQIQSLEQELEDNAIISGASGFGLLKRFLMNKSDAEITRYNEKYQEKGQEQRDDEIKTELDQYRQKIIESRLRRKRMEEMIKAEQQKNPIDINNTLIIACSQRIIQETRGLEAYSENLREKVITIGWKSKVRRSVSRPGAILGKAREWVGR